MTNNYLQFYMSILTFVLMYLNFLGAIWVAVDLLRSRRQVSPVYIIFLVAACYQFLNPEIVLYNTDAETKWLNNVSMYAYSIFMPLYVSLLAYRFYSAIKGRQTISFKQCVEFVFLCIISFPSVLLSRTNLISVDEGRIDFWGYFAKHQTKIFDVTYWSLMLFILVFSIIYLLYIFKYCEDKRSMCYVSVLGLALIAYLRRATFFFINPFGLMIMLESACGFIIIAILLYLKFKIKIFGYIVVFFSAPSAIAYMISYTGAHSMPDFFSYMNIDSLLFHSFMIPVGFSVLGFEKFDNFKMVLKSSVLLSLIRIPFAVLGYVFGYLEYHLDKPFNVEIYYNGFLYKQFIFPFLESWGTAFSYVKNGIVFYPLNFIIIPVLFFMLQIITFFCITKYRTIRQKCKEKTLCLT
ncbi:MAG: hypothetical protein LBF12_07000 [Christensenellaceae bacterium]|nr:hypothetical protein [Christensenellaceae bacterium]